MMDTKSYGNQICRAIKGKKAGIHTLVAGAWTERKIIYHGGSFLKLADDNKYIKNPEAKIGV